MPLATCPICSRQFESKPGDQIPVHTKGLPAHNHPRCPGSGRPAFEPSKRKVQKKVAPEQPADTIDEEITQ